MFRKLLACCLVFMSATVLAQSLPLANSSFEDGDGLPAHWSLSGGKGAWENQGHTGGRSVSVTGAGQDSAAWKSDALPLVPGETYRITFWTRTDPGAQSGCITAGVGGVNRDFEAGAEWEKKTFIFKNACNASEGQVHLGQWNKKGRVWFDDVEIHRVIPRHLQAGVPYLSADETITSGTYKFRTRLSSECSNYSRPEVEHTAGFNSDRWCFGDDQHILYRFAVKGLDPFEGEAFPHCIYRIPHWPQASAHMAFNINYYVKGECAVEASGDGKTWSPLGRFNALGKQEITLPANMFPAPAVWVRFTGTGNFQINSICYEAKLTDSEPDITGSTWFIEPLAAVKDLDVQVESLGDVLPGGGDEAVLSLANKGFWGKKVLVSLEAGPEGEEAAATKEVDVSGFSKKKCEMPYALRGVGPQRVCLTITDKKSGAVLVTASQARTIAAINDASFGYRLSGEDGLGLWWAEGTYKVGRTRPIPAQTQDAISICAARNEYEPFQLVLRPKVDLRGVTLRASDLTCGQSVIKSGNVRIETVEYVPVETATDSFGCPGEWPDPLVPYEKPLDLAAGRNQPIWFTVHVPEDAPAGEYQGSIEISSLARVPLKLTVWDFTLPKETHTKTAYGVSLPANWLGLKKPEDLAAAHDLYMRNCAEHRVCPYDPMAFAHWKYTLSGPPEDPVVTYDFTEFDKAAHRYLDLFRFNAFNFGGIPNELQKHKRFTPEFNALFARIYGPIVQHLREKGWLDKAYCYWFDEPAPKDYPYVVEGMKLLKQACPGLQRLLTEQPEPELYGAVDIWTPVLGNYNPVRCHERQADGQQVWWYVCCGPRAPYPNNFIDHPAVNHRIRFWMMRKYGVTGSLYWATTYYHGAKGVLRNPWTSAMSVSPEGGTWGNGDGMLLYPPVREPAKEPTIKGPYNSIRWEMLREGLEDREYFWLLEQAIAQAKKNRGGASDPLISEAEETLNLPKSFITDLTHYSKDAQDIYAARAKIAGYIERLATQK